MVVYDRNEAIIMGGLFSGSKTTKMAPPKPVPPPPVDTADQAGERSRKKWPGGREATFLTGDLTPKESEKKKKLG